MLFADSILTLWLSCPEVKLLSLEAQVLIRCGTFFYLTLVEERWISYTIPDRFSQWVDPNFDDFKDIDSLKKYMQQTKINTEMYLEKLSNEELNRQIVIP